MTEVEMLKLIAKLKMVEDEIEAGLFELKEVVKELTKKWKEK